VVVKFHDVIDEGTSTLVLLPSDQPPSPFEARTACRRGGSVLAGRDRIQPLLSAGLSPKRIPVWTLVVRPRTTFRMSRDWSS